MLVLGDRVFGKELDLAKRHQSISMRLQQVFSTFMPLAQWEEMALNRILNLVGLDLGFASQYLICAE